MILVTGASGLLGSKVASQALEMNREVAGVYCSHAWRVPGADAHKLDLRDFVATRRLVERLRPASIIHCAAATNVDWCEDDPAEADRLNVQVPVFLAQLAAELDAQFVQVSTDSVFDGERGNYSELDIPAPLNVYARTKLLAEQEVQRVHRSSLIARVTFYGWNVQNKQSLAEWVLAGLSAGKNVPGFTDVFFCPILANDLAEILLSMMSRHLHGIYNVVGAERLSKYEFARRLGAMFGLDVGQVVPVSIKDAALRAPRPRDTSLTTKKIARELAREMPDVESGLRKFRELRERQGVGIPQSSLAGAER